jgi:hypothetical protein
MGKRTFGAIIACALACVIAACGSSHGTTRTSLINATTPTTGKTATTASTPGTLTLGEKVPDPSALPQAGVSTTITPTGPTPTSTTTAPSTTSTAATVAIPPTGPLNASQFKAAANEICLYIDNKARSIGGAGATASSSAAIKLEALEVLSRQAASQLHSLAPRGPAAWQKKDDAFVKETDKEIAIGVLAEQDANVGDQSDYVKELDQLSKISKPVVAAGKALAPACAAG